MSVSRRGRATKPGAYVENTSHPTVPSAHDGCCKLGPHRPHTMHRACWRNMSDDTFGTPSDHEGHKRDGHAVTAGVALGFAALPLRR